MRKLYKFGAHIAKIRGKLKLSQPAAADLLEVKLGTYRNWEQSRRVPHSIMQEAILSKMDNALFLRRSP